MRGELILRLKTHENIKETYYTSKIYIEKRLKSQGIFQSINKKIYLKNSRLKIQETVMKIPLL